MRSRARPDQLLLPTVAHVLFGGDGRPRAPVRVGAAEARVVAAVALPARRSYAADAALLALPESLAAPLFFPAAGHLSRYCHRLRVVCIGPTGEQLRGALVRGNWSGPLHYTFGSRRLVDQWIIETTGAASLTRPGDSGVCWTTEDGVAVGLQIGVLRHDRRFVILTPMTTLCHQFDVATAV